MTGKVGGWIKHTGIAAKKSQVRPGGKGMYQIALKKADCVTFTPVELDKTDMSIAAVPVSESDRKLFGLSEKTARLPGYRHYCRQ
ncbi:MAG: hypothetical protein ACYS7Y_20515 [Planctomycetota bacterium]|jgi:hypothetical protein